MTSLPPFDSNAISKLKLYIGLPTQEQRTIQSQIAQQISDLFRIPYARLVDKREADIRFANVDLSSAAASQEDLAYLAEHSDHFASLLQGATCHTSVYGYWMGGSKRKRRIDDATEIIEFIVTPDTFGISAVLLFLELTCPALFAAEQEAILVVSQHPKILENHSHPSFRSQQLHAMRQKDATLGLESKSLSANAKGGVELSMIDGLAFTLRNTIALKESLKYGFIAEFGGGEDDINQWQDAVKKSISTWLASQYIDQRQLERKLQGADEDKFCEYLDLTTKSNWAKKLSPLIGGSQSNPPPSFLSIPAVSLRVLTTSITWWLFYGHSPAVLEHANESPDGEQASDSALWSLDFCDHLCRICCEWLEHLEECWLKSARLPSEFGMPKESTYQGFFKLNKESTDPLPNAMLWLAFLRDCLHFYRNCLPDKELIRPGNRKDPLVDFESGALEESRSTQGKIKDWIAIFNERAKSSRSRQITAANKIGDGELWFDRVYQLLFGEVVPAPKNKKNTKIEGWSRAISGRLDILEQIEDEFFPDDHLISAWRLFLRLHFEQLRISGDTDKELNPIKWNGADWWVETNRKWRQSHVMAQMWLSPLALEIAFFSYRSEWYYASKEHFKKSRKHSRQQLEEKVHYQFALNPSVFHKPVVGDVCKNQNAALITQLAEKAIFGFPFKLGKKITNQPSIYKQVLANDKERREQLFEEMKRSIQSITVTDWIKAWQEADARV